jgi:hypothetical protein
MISAILVAAAGVVVGFALAMFTAPSYWSFREQENRSKKRIISGSPYIGPSREEISLVLGVVSTIDDYHSKHVKSELIRKLSGWLARS